MSADCMCYCHLPGFPGGCSACCLEPRPWLPTKLPTMGSDEFRVFWGDRPILSGTAVNYAAIYRAISDVSQITMVVWRGMAVDADTFRERAMRDLREE